MSRTASASRTVALLCHPATPCPGVERIEVEVGFTAAGGLSLAYRLRGRIDALRIPAPQPSRAAEGLWEHTCCEAFVAAGSPAYREFNFSPSGQWAAYAFAGYRQRTEAAAPGPAPAITVRRLADRLDLDALLAPALLPGTGPGCGAALELGLACVVEAADGSRSYWALAHPAARPDFHQRAAFSLRLPAYNTNP